METATQVNVDHALPISKIEQIKADLRDYYGVKELSEEQSESINQHINILDAALMQFMSDNHTLEKKHADTQDVNLNLYHGLKRMYNDLLHELGRVKEEKLTPKLQIATILWNTWLMNYLTNRPHNGRHILTHLL